MKKQEVLSQISLILILPVVLFLGYYIKTKNPFSLALTLLTVSIAFFLNAYSD